MQNKTDFTLSAYKQLISTLQAQGYFFQTFKGFIQNPKEKVLILRHDIDRVPENALKMARMEINAGIKASYYFRIVKKSYDENVIRQIAEMGHEIGYNYENLSEISRKKEVRGQKSENGGRRAISRRPTQTHTDIYPADPPDKKVSSLREKSEDDARFAQVLRSVGLL
jgi:hypothetical protein